MSPRLLLLPHEQGITESNRLEQNAWNPSTQVQAVRWEPHQVRRFRKCCNVWMCSLCFRGRRPCFQRPSGCSQSVVFTGNSVFRNLCSYSSVFSGFSGGLFVQSLSPKRLDRTLSSWPMFSESCVLTVVTFCQGSVLLVLYSFIKIVEETSR